MARIDEFGSYFIVDRKKELIIRGGYNVYPREVEEVLYEHPAVREAAVIGVPHDTLGEEVGAAVALRSGAHATEAEIRDYVKSNVAACKYPRRVWFVDEPPKGFHRKDSQARDRAPRICPRDALGRICPHLGSSQVTRPLRPGPEELQTWE